MTPATRHLTLALLLLFQLNTAPAQDIHQSGLKHSVTLTIIKSSPDDETCRIQIHID